MSKKKKAHAGYNFGAPFFPAWNGLLFRRLPAVRFRGHGGAGAGASVPRQSTIGRGSAATWFP